MTISNNYSPIKIINHIKNSLGMGLGRILAQIINLLIIPIILIYIKPSEYGVFALLETSTLILGVLMSLGLSTVFMSQFNQTDDKNAQKIILNRTLTQQTFYGGVVLVFLLSLSGFISNLISSSIYLNALLFLLFKEYFSNHNIIFSRWQMLTDRHWIISLKALVKTIVYLLVSYIFVYFYQMDILGLAIGYLSGEIIVFFINLYFEKNYLKIISPLPDTKSILKLGLPAMPDTIFFWLIVSAPLYFLRLNGKNAEAGYFGIAWRIASSLDVVGNSLASGAAKQIIKSTNYIDSKNLNKIFRFSLNILLIFSLTLSWFTPEFLQFFFPESYQPTTFFIPMCITGFYFLSLYYFEWIGISGTSKTYGLSIASGTGAIISIFLFLLINENITNIFSSLIFLLSFFFMWFVARLLRSGYKFGNVIYLTISGLFVILSSSLIYSLKSSIFIILIIKIISLLILACFLFGKALFDLAKESGDFSESELPTYKMIKSLIRDPEFILDIGCSEGFFLAGINSKKRVGVDNDLELLVKGKKTYENILFVCADANNLPFKNNSFSTVVLIGSLPYFTQPEKVLNEISKTVTNNGQLLISAVTDHFIYRFINIYKLRYNLNFFSKEQIKSLINNQNLIIDELTEKGYFIAPILSNLYSVSSFIDRKILRSQSVIGPIGKKARWLTNPIINWEFNNINKTGYQWYVSARKNNQ